MKKVFLLLLSLCLFLIVGTANANMYQHFLDGDTNYVMVDGHTGEAWYLDRSSLYVEKYDPPQYIIVANICYVPKAINGSTTITKVTTHRFFYNWDMRKMYWDKGGNSNWVYLDPQGDWAHTGIVMPAGEMAFYLAYRMKFYGSLLFYNSYDKKYFPRYSDRFYEGV